ncbi:MAG: lactate racemase domain-containing protein [Myxococcota bacterium]|nr:lactate racemase domain-containing protein [Myxococcota bacterium]
MLELPYGRVPYPLDLGGRAASVIEAVRRPAPPPVEDLLVAALRSPIDRPQLRDLVGPGARVTVIVSDATRVEPRGQFLATLRTELPHARWTVAVATGTHGPANLDALDLPPDLGDVINHDGHATRDLVSLGTTARGTPVRVHRCVVETDLVIATGCIKPHYFAGFGAGCKAIFPGLGEATAIRINHRLKTADGARAGIVDGNPCREDLEEAVALVPTPVFLVNGVLAPDGLVHAVVAGDPRAAFRRGCDLARSWFTVRAPKASLVIASDALPVTASLYQAAKIASACAPLVADGGDLVLVAECAEGTGPLDTVNEAIFRIGVLPRLPTNAKIHLVSALPREVVERTVVRPLTTLTPLLERADSIVVVPRASQLILETDS